MPDARSGFPVRSGFRRRWTVVAARIAVLLASVALSGCNPFILNPKGPAGGGDSQILIGSVIMMLAIVVPTILATLAFAWRFQSSNGRARYLPD